MTASGELKITLKRSPIGRQPRHIATVKALGLRRLNHTVVKTDNPQVRGMVNKVAYLLEVEEV